MSRLRDWWLTRRWPWWPDAMKVARDLDAEARATFTDDKAVGLGRVAPAPGESAATTEQVPVLLLEPRTAMMMTDPTTGEATEGQVEAIIKAGLQRLTWPAALVEPAAGWTLRRTAVGIELRDAHGGPWVRCAVMLDPRWDQCGGRLEPDPGAVRRAAGGPCPAQPGKPPLRPGRAASGTQAGEAGGDRGCRVRALAHTQAEYPSEAGSPGPSGVAPSERRRYLRTGRFQAA